MERIRVEIGIACLRLAALLARVPGLFRLAVVCVYAGALALPDEYRKAAAVKIQWERARVERQLQEQHERQHEDQGRQHGRTVA